ncbi:MAG: PilZ domain-containing protein [Firmicutes bacterium]|nr:PilZ domain-containing protein [Bacillota bacterium]MCL5065010.1 PilZ domain-containing protein [Bacillota bacterium]
MASGRRRKAADPSRALSTAQSGDHLPPVKSVVQVSFQDTHGGSQPKAVYFSRIVLRKGDVDYLDAMRDDHGEVTNAWGDTGSVVRLWWGQNEHLWEYPIEIREVLDPVVALEVLYLGPARRHNRRREARAKTQVPARFQLLLDPADEEPADLSAAPPTPTQPSITRDISYSGVRFFSPQLINPGTMLRLEVSLDSETSWLTHSAEVLRSAKALVPFQASSGYDVVSLWNPPLENEALDRWTQFFNQHRYD